MNDKFNEDVLKEVVEYGFDENLVKLAMKLSNDKEEIINMVIQMCEDSNYAEQIKRQTHLPLDMSSFKLDNYKMVIIVKEDLQLSKGKLAAQVAHAVLGAYKKGVNTQPQVVQMWENYSGQAKIVLGVPNEKELLDLKTKADSNGLPTCIIADAGRTEIAPNTITCCAIGPGAVDDINKITGHLKLL